MTKDTALRMAIEIMERLHQPNGNSVQLAIQACKEALAETQEPVPIAILHRKRLEVYSPKLTIHEKADVTFLKVDETDRESNMRYQSLADGDYKLFTTPPSREWVGLSDEEISELWYKSQNDVEGVNLGFTTQEHFFAGMIEAKLREKNNG